MAKIPKRLIERLMKEYGAKRISREAKEMVEKNLNKEIKIITILALRNAKYSGRKLITKEDIEYAFKQLKFF